jgi:hypothetical protein
MSQTRKKRWKKPVLIGSLVVVFAAAITYWYVATEKFSDTSKKKATYTVNAIDFIREFQANDSLASAKYADKIVTVNGTVSELEAPDTSTVNVKIIDTTTNNFIIFAFQEQHLAEGKSLKVGDAVSIKGSCSGGHLNSILEVIKIDFKRAALNK